MKNIQKFNNLPFYQRTIIANALTMTAIMVFISISYFAGIKPLFVLQILVTITSIFGFLAFIDIKQPEKTTSLGWKENLINTGIFIFFFVLPLFFIDSISLRFGRYYVYILLHILIGFLPLIYLWYYKITRGFFPKNYRIILLILIGAWYIFLKSTLYV